MSFASMHLGKIFLSHSSVDKPFVRKLAQAIESAGFSVWLDEKELLPGDSLAKKISQALDEATVILVVVSSASIASKWLSFELNKATDRMVKGNCRLIPIVIERVKLPPEVEGLLYADFTGDFVLASRSVLTAIKHEAHRRAWSHSFWSRAELLVKSTFGSTGYMSITGEYKDKDFNVAYLDKLTDEDDDVSIPYEVVSRYSKSTPPLSELWWTEYSNTISELDEKLYLVITERPLGFPTDAATYGAPRVSYRSLGWKNHIYGYVVFVDLSGLEEEEPQQRLLEAAKKQLTDHYKVLSARDA